MAHKEKSGLATAGMVLGIIGICLSLIPIINNIAFLLAALGLVFGIVGIVQTKDGKKAGKGKAIAAIILAVLTIGLVLASQKLFSDALDDAGDALKTGEVDTSSSEEKKKEEFKVGEVIAFDGKEVTVTKVTRNWTQEFNEPAANKEYVKVNVQLQNKSDKEVDFNVFDWSLQDSNGTIQDTAMAFDDSDQLDSGKIAPGGKAEGSIIFEVPAGDENLTLRYQPSFWSDKRVEVKL